MPKEQDLEEAKRETIMALEDYDAKMLELQAMEEEAFESTTDKMIQIVQHKLKALEFLEQMLITEEALSVKSPSPASPPKAQAEFRLPKLEQVSGCGSRLLEKQDLLRLKLRAKGGWTSRPADEAVHPGRQTHLTWLRDGHPSLHQASRRPEHTLESTVKERHQRGVRVACVVPALDAMWTQYSRRVWHEDPHHLS